MRNSISKYSIVGKTASALIFLFILTSAVNAQQIFIRINQVGFLPGDIKSGIVLSKASLENIEFRVVCFENKKVEYNGKLEKSLGGFANFARSYRFDFTDFEKKGKYLIEIGDAKSHLFKIDDDVYNHVVDSLMQFFKVQRCGYTNPFLHDICHRADATRLIENGIPINKSADLTGGWHDAGDYVKFLNTTAFTTYTLLFAYDFDRQKFEFDNNNNFIPDVLEEAKVGLDWLLRCNFDKYKLVTQVQDLRDHEQGFRLPENDKLEYDRPAFVGMGKNIIGIYVAALSLASRIWADRFYDKDFADRCLTTAENLYSIRGMVPDVDSSGSGMYLDSSYEGKLALGAVELYLTTNRKIILDEAVKLADEAGSEFWWSWGNIAPYAHYRLAKINYRFGDYIKNNLVAFNANKDSTLFNEGTALTWGSNNTLLGIALQNILWKDLTDSTNFDTLAIFQRDFVLGRNQWGVCFMNNIGTEFSRNFHHQVSYLTDGNLPGGFAAGPVPLSLLEQYNIPFEVRDRFGNFQTDDAVYRDDPMDYVTNEPTISANATAIFVLGYYSKR